MTGTYPRSKEEVDKEIAILRKNHLKIIKSRESAKAFLVRAGLLGKDGKPTERYRND